MPIIKNQDGTFSDVIPKNVVNTRLKELRDSLRAINMQLPILQEQRKGIIDRIAAMNAERSAIKAEVLSISKLDPDFIDEADSTL